MTIRKGGIRPNYRDIVQFAYETDPETGQCVCIGIKNGCEIKRWDELETQTPCFVSEDIGCEEFLGEPAGGQWTVQCFDGADQECDQFLGEAVNTPVSVS